MCNGWKNGDMKVQSLEKIFTAKAATILPDQQRNMQSRDYILMDRISYTLFWLIPSF